MECNAVAWRVEEACLNAWPALREVLFGGWALRFSGGLTRRANSANPLGFQRIDADALIAGCEALYSHNRQPTIFRLLSLIGSGMDEHLEMRGYGSEGLSLVLYAEIGAIPALRDSEVRLSPRPTREWLAAMAALQGQTKTQAGLYRGIVGALAIPAAFATLVDDGGPAALAFGGVHNAMICYESVVTDLQRRRRGYAQRIITTLASWAQEQGAAAACLEVEAANTAAVALYQRLGFREIYRYHYRRQPSRAV